MKAVTKKPYCRECKDINELEACICGYEIRQAPTVAVWVEDLPKYCPFHDTPIPQDCNLCARDKKVMGYISKNYIRPTELIDWLENQKKSWEDFDASDRTKWGSEYCDWIETKMQIYNSAIQSVVNHIEKNHE